MNHATLLHHRSLWSLDRLTADDVSTVLDTAAGLKRSAEGGHPQQPLRGRNVALVCSPSAELAEHGFDAAAAALGARVSQVRPSQDAHETARVLGRLYDAIECEGLPQVTVEALDRDSGKPVFNGLATASHPLRVLGDLLTLRELAGRPLADISLCVKSPAGSPAAQAWQRSAALTGLKLRIAASAGAAPAAHEFTWDEHGTRCADGRAELACECRGSDELAAAQMLHQHYVLQALLCSTVA